jgi:hypothetical protein
MFYSWIGHIQSLTKYHIVSYDFIVKSSKGTVLELKNQKAPHGNGIQSIRFTQSGPATVSIKAVAIGDNSLGEFAEGADFEIVVKELPYTGLQRVNTMELTHNPGYQEEA